MRKHYLIKYIDKEGNTVTVIDKEQPEVDIKSLVHDMKHELKKYNGVEYPTFAIEELNEKEYCYLKRKGYYSLGE